MKITTTAIISLAAFLSTVKADFELYQVGLGGNGISANVEGWQVYQNEANCDTALNWIWRDSKDVSGNKFGVRCEGDGCTRGGVNGDKDPANIDVTEMNFNRGDFHWSKLTFPQPHPVLSLGTC